MKKFLITTTIFFIFALYQPAIAGAATLSMSSDGSVRVGDTFEVLLNADTGGESINSVSLDIKFSPELLSFSGYKDENAVIKLWIDSPEEQNGVVHLTGIIPGGVSGLYDAKKSGVSPIPLVRLLFTAHGIGQTELSFLDTKILENDGKGTKLETNNEGVVLVINPATPSKDVEKDLIDQVPPEKFEVTFLESSLFSRTPSMLLFESRDAESGIKGYQMRIGSGEWRDVKSPTPVSKMLFSRQITVRAMDFLGNFEEASLIIPGLVPPKVFYPILILLVVSFIWAFKLLKYKA